MPALQELQMLENSPMAEKVKIAGVQMDIALGQPETNLQRMAETLETTAQQGAQLTVFPECAVTGYCFDSLEEAQAFYQRLLNEHPDIVKRLQAAADEARADLGDRLTNRTGAGRRPAGRLGPSDARTRLVGQ